MVEIITSVWLEAVLTHIFVLGHHLFFETHSFPGASLSVICGPFRTKHFTWNGGEEEVNKRYRNNSKQVMGAETLATYSRFMKNLWLKSTFAIMRSTSRYHDNLKELCRFCTLFFSSHDYIQSIPSPKQILCKAGSFWSSASGVWNRSLGC